MENQTLTTRAFIYDIIKLYKLSSSFWIAMIVCMSQAWGQKTLSFKPQLTEGQRYEYQSKVDMKLYIDGAESELLSLFMGGGKNKSMMTSSMVLKVNKVLSDAYEFQIINQDVASPVPFFQNIMDSAMLNNFPPTIVSVDKQFQQQKLINWQEMQTAFKGMMTPIFNAFIANIRSMTPKSTNKDSLARFDRQIEEARKKMALKTDSLLDSQQKIEAMLEDSYLPYLEAYQRNFGIGKDNVQTGLMRTSKDRLKMFTQDFILATVYDRLVKREGTMSKCYTKIVYDETSLKEMISKKGKSANVVKCTETKNYTFNSKTQLLTNVDHDIVFELDNMKFVVKVQSVVKALN